MSTTIGRVVFNPAPGAAAPSTGNSTETVMMSYGGGLSPKQILDRIATLERENAKLRESEHESDALRMSLTDKLTRIAVAVKGEPPPLTLWGWDDLPEVVAKQSERIKALEAHIQQSADLCQQRLDKFQIILKMTKGQISPTHPQLIQRDFHLAALQPKEPSNG